MVTRWPAAVVLLLLLAMAGPASARVSIIYPFLGRDAFTMAVADQWMVNVGAGPDPAALDNKGVMLPRLVTAMPDDGMPLWFGIWMPPELTSINRAGDYIANLGVVLLDEVKVNKRRTDVLNNMDVIYVSGTGSKGGEPMDFYAAFVQLDASSVVIAIYIGPEETTRAHSKDLLEMINSLRPLPVSAKAGP